MKFKKIVGFGDSWIWGDELIDPQLRHRDDAHPVLIENVEYREANCFLGLLGQHYGVPVENFGIPGGSLQSALWTYLWWLDHEQLDVRDCLILVGHTDPNRTSFYNPTHTHCANNAQWNQFVHSAWVYSGSSSVPDEWVDVVKKFTVLTSCKELHQLTYQQSILFFEGQYYKLSKNVLQFSTIGGYVPIGADNIIRPDYPIRNLVAKRPELLAPTWHPNEQGHIVIRDHLINQLDRVILA
jgi:hypothetical protein